MIGIVRNPYAPRVADHLAAAAREAGHAHRVIDLATLAVRVDDDGPAAVRDRDGTVRVDAVAPYLLFGHPAAVHGLRVLARSAHVQNPVDGVLVADDKAATAIRLSLAGVRQVPTHVIPFDVEQALATAEAVGYPVVVKRTHGAQGRWVRRAGDAARLRTAVDELGEDGPTALVVQPEVSEFSGRSVRAIVTGGRLVAATIRTAAGEEWRSNIAGGASQTAVVLDAVEERLAEDAAAAVGLGHAGVDILRSAAGSLVVEVNSCPDFTSMLPHVDVDLTASVLRASLAPR